MRAHRVLCFLFLAMISFSSATNWNACPLAASGAGTTYDLTGSVTSTGTCVTISAANVVIDCHGFTIDGDDSGTSDYAVTGTGISGATVKNCVITDFAASMNMDNWDNTIIRNNTISGQDQAVSVIKVLTGSDNNIIDNNTIGTITSTDGILKLTGTTTGNNITSNIFTAASTTPIWGSATNSNYLIKNNTITETAGAAFQCILSGNTAGNGNVIDGNTITSGSANTEVIYIATGSANIVKNNIIHDNGGIGIRIASANNNVTNNTVYNVGASKAHISIENSGMNVTNNLIYGTGGGATWAAIKLTADAADNVVIQNNIIGNITTNGIYIIGGDSAIIGNNSIYNTTRDAILFDTTATGSIIQNNTINLVSANGIKLSSTDGTVTISNNTLIAVGIASSGAGITSAADSVNISKNIIYNGYDGIINNGDSGVMGNNTLYNLTNKGIQIGTTASSDNVVWTNDTLYNITKDAVLLVTFTGNNFTNITIYNQTVYINQTGAGTSLWVNATLAFNSTVGKIYYPAFNFTAAAAVVEDTTIRTDPVYAVVDSTVLTTLNRNATLTLLTDITCINVTIGTTSIAFPTYAQMLAYAATSGTASCVSGIATYNVTTWTGYLIGANGSFGGVWLVPENESPITGAANISRILNITFFDESTLAAINIDNAVLSFQVTVNPADGSNRNFTISYVNASNISSATVKAYPNTTNATLNSIEAYSKSLYTSRSRFMINANTNLSIQQNLSIYLLPDSLANYAIVSVVDRGDAVQGAYVQILKFFSSSTQYTLTDMRITNSEGQFATYIDPIAYYKFVVIDSDGTILYTSISPEQFICDTTCKITIDINTQNLINLLGPYANSSCTANETTNVVTCGYTDPSGKTSAINFLIYRQNSRTPAYNNTVSASSTQVVVNMTTIGENLTTYWYQWEIWRTASPPLMHGAGIFDRRIIDAISDWMPMGLTFILVVATAAASIPVAIGLAGMSLVVMTYMGVMNLSFETTVPIMMVCFVVAFMLAKRE